MRPEPRRIVTKTGALSAQALGFKHARRARPSRLPHSHPDADILVHTRRGPVRAGMASGTVIGGMVARLRRKHYRVQVACESGSTGLVAGGGSKRTLRRRARLPSCSVLTDRAGILWQRIPAGHLAAFAACPPLPLFGPQVAEWFAPLHPASEWLEGKAALTSPVPLLPFLGPLLHGEFKARRKCRAGGHRGANPACRKRRVIQSTAGISPVRQPPRGRSNKSRQALLELANALVCSYK